MKTEETHRDPYIAKLFAEAGEVPPGEQFANRILRKIEVETKSSTFTYTPPISKKAWLLLTVVGIAMFVTLYFTSSSSASPKSLFDINLRPDFTFLEQMMQKVTFSFEFGPVMQTALIAMAVFIFIQMILIEWRNRTIYK